MITKYWNNLEYREYKGIGTTGQSAGYKEPVYIKGIRLKGQNKFSYGDDGDTTSSSVVYKTVQYIVPKSKLDGKEVMECVKVAAFGRDHGYMVYVK